MILLSKKLIILVSLTFVSSVKPDGKRFFSFLFSGFYDDYYPDYYGGDYYEGSGSDYFGGDDTEEDTSDYDENDEDDSNSNGWGECSRTCGWGTQVRTPTKSASDFKDCKLKDCPQETCTAPFHKRYGLRSHSCCDVTPLMTSQQVCGASSLQTGIGNLIGKIVGGKSSKAKRFPWMVGIKVDGKQHCGGVLINSNWVLTAAHCFVYDGGRTQKLSSVELVFGTIDIDDTLRTNRNIQISGVKRLVYKNYKFPKNDIALLKLTKPPRFTDYVQPICLPEGEVLPDDANCVAAGWGDKKATRKNDNIMNEVEIRLLPDKLCEKAYGRRFYKNMMKCAGKVKGGIDTCQGDSGGPLMCQRCGSCQWITYGVVSFGDGCALKHKPGVYVMVNNYADWIRSVTGMQKSDKTYQQCSNL